MRVTLPIADDVLLVEPGVGRQGRDLGVADGEGCGFGDGGCHLALSG